MIIRSCGRTFKRVAEHRDLFLDLVIFGDLSDAAPRPHQCDCSVLRGTEALVDILLNVDERDVVDPAMGADEGLLESFDAVGRGAVVVVSSRCSAFLEGAGSARGRRDLDMQSGPRRASRC